jgi:HAE1 family hydrophobic/amphiphilic exporter-1
MQRCLQMILAIGIVVDDAIVVVEAVHAKLDEGAKSGKEATISAMNEITGAIVSYLSNGGSIYSGIVLKRIHRVFYQQFAITLDCYIILSR